MAYSMDLRQRVADGLDRGESKASIARRLEIGQRTVERYQWRRDRGPGLEAGTPGPKGSVKLSEADEQFLVREVERQPGVRAKDLIPKLSVKVSESAVCRALQRLGLTRKKRR